MEILEQSYGSREKEQEIDHTNLPKLPIDIFEKIVHMMHGKNTYRNFCKGKLISDEINKLPFSLKFDSLGDLDEFFMFHANNYTIGQLTNPIGDKETLFARQFTEIVEKTLEKNASILGSGARRGSQKRTVRINLWIYKLILYRYVRDDIDTNIDDKITVSDSDSLFEFRTKLSDYIIPRDLVSWKLNGQKEFVSIQNRRVRRRF